MALIVITVRDTETGAVVSLAAEPPMDMSAAPAGEAQMLVHRMLGALPMNAPARDPDVAEGLAEPGPDPDAPGAPLVAGPHGPVE